MLVDSFPSVSVSLNITMNANKGIIKMAAIKNIVAFLVMSNNKRVSELPSLGSFYNGFISGCNYFFKIFRI